MSEPGDSIEHEQKLELVPAELDLIHDIDFRINNILTHMLSRLAAMAEHPTDVSEQAVLKKFQLFLFTRVEAITTAKPILLASEKPALRQLAGDMQGVSEQLMCFAGAISMFLRNPDRSNAQHMYATIEDAYKRMRANIDAVLITRPTEPTRSIFYRTI